MCATVLVEYIQCRTKFATLYDIDSLTEIISFVSQEEIIALERENLRRESIAEFMAVQSNPDLALERLFCVPIADKRARKLGQLPGAGDFAWADEVLEVSREALMRAASITTDAEWKEYKADSLRSFQAMYRG